MYASYVEAKMKPGASKEAIDTAEDRELFKQAMSEINIDVAPTF